MNAIVVIAASKGSLQLILRIVGALPLPCIASIFISRHIGEHPSVLPDLLDNVSRLPAAFAEDGMLIELGRIHVAPRDRHMLLEPFCVRLSDGPESLNARPAADFLFIHVPELHERHSRITVPGVNRRGGSGADRRVEPLMSRLQ